MFQQLLYRFLKRRHFWRYASFSEVAELYASRTMRLLGVRMVSLFVALFLHQNGYSLLFIAGYFASYYGLKVAISYFAALYAAKFGPKHGILLGNLLYIPALVAFTLVPEYGVYAVAVFGFFQAWSVTIYDLCYLVSFSKVKNNKHAGKELGFMSLLEKGTTALSPLVGGTIAYFFGVEVTIWLAAAFFVAASIPMLRSPEPTKTGQKLVFARFPWRTTWRGIRGESAIGFDIVACTVVWVLFVALTIFGGSSDDIYLKIGALTSISFVTTFIAAFTFGRLIDRRRGGDLLKISALVNILVHGTRPFVTTPVGAGMVNVVDETVTTGYSMAFTRGMFDTADLTGRRIVYLLFIEMALNAGSMLACLVLAACLCFFASDVHAMQAFFGVTALYVLFIFLARFNLYKR